MTLQDLIDELSALPASARTATVTIRSGEIDDFCIASVRYETGEVIIEADHDD